MSSQSNNMLDSVQFTPYEVETVLKSLKTGKASGPDSINNRIFKELSQTLSHPICDLFNQCQICGSKLSSLHFLRKWCIRSHRLQADFSP